MLFLKNHLGFNELCLEIANVLVDIFWKFLKDWLSGCGSKTNFSVPVRIDLCQMSDMRKNRILPQTYFSGPRNF